MEEVKGRTVTVDVSNILDLICCADDYGFGQDVLMDAFAGMLGYRLSDAEIRAFAARFMAPEMRAKGYGQEDRSRALERLREFKRRYIAGRGDGHG